MCQHYPRHHICVSFVMVVDCEFIHQCLQNICLCVPCIRWRVSILFQASHLCKFFMVAECAFNTPVFRYVCLCTRYVCALGMSVRQVCLSLCLDCTPIFTVLTIKMHTRMHAYMYTSMHRTCTQAWHAHNMYIMYVTRTHIHTHTYIH